MYLTLVEMLHIKYLQSALTYSGVGNYFIRIKTIAYIFLDN